MQPKKKTNIWAVNSGTPIFPSAGAMTVARIKYAAVVGKPMPRMIAVIAVSAKATSGIPPERTSMNPDSFAPRPDMARIPAMIPAAAQATDIGIAFFAPV